MGGCGVGCRDWRERGGYGGEIDGVEGGLGDVVGGI